MVSDKTQRSASNSGERSRPTIPIRRSSISRAFTKGPRDRQRKPARHSLFLDNGCHLDVSIASLNSQSTTSVTPRQVKRTHSSSKMISRSTSCSVSSRTPIESVQVQRWAGLTRSVCSWDGLRKDPELWVQDGDCRVHLYGHGASRRGPSFCVPLRALRQKSCGAMLDICYAQTISESSTVQEPRRMQSFDNLHRGSTLVELYIPPPEDASREESYNWHITTRNFFAYVLGKPLVGRQMGQAFVDLLERMKLFRSEYVNNHQDFLEYAENQGYRDLVECTDYALASLFYAERYKLRDVWIDAFAHCVGMSDSITLSPEYTSISRITKALVSRANIEMYAHLNRVEQAIRTFLHDDLSPAYLGLADEARHHLNSFQRFLHQFYVEKFGYWPPPKSASSFPKALYKSLFYDFKSLYDLLVDAQSNTDISCQRPASGGICVLQNVDQFDKRHKFTAQPHPLPLLPARTGPQKTARSLSSASRQKTQDTRSGNAALAAATNILDSNFPQPRIIDAYLQFEMTSATSPSQREKKLTAVDARKVGWLLIYGMLQYLTSVLRAPVGVRDVESPEYPLCCLVAGQASWNAGTPVTTPLVNTAASTPQAISGHNDGPQCSPYAIEPDCHREDYFSSQPPARPLNYENKAYLPIRQSSIRSLGPLSSLSVRSSRRNSLTLKPTPHCAIIVHGYGDGLNQATLQAPSQGSTDHRDTVESSPSADTNIPEDTKLERPLLRSQTVPLPSIIRTTSTVGVRGHNRTRTPLLHTSQLGPVPVIALVNTDDLADSMIRSDSTSSMGSSVWTDAGSAASSKSSANGEGPFYKTSTAAHNGLLGGLVSVDGTRVSLDNSENRPPVGYIPQSDIHPLLRKASVQQNKFQFDFGAQDLQEAEITKSTEPIGMALSTPAHTPTPLYSVPLSKEFSTSTPASIADTATRKKNRGSDVFTGLITTPSELRSLYNSALKRLDSSSNITTRPGDSQKGSKSGVQPPIVTKTSHATRMPSLRDRIWSDDGKDAKKERRKSSLWRR